MYGVHVESEFVWQNCRCWQDIWTFEKVYIICCKQ